MSELKTKVTNASVSEFINALPDEARRRDCLTLLGLFEKVTGEQAKMWGAGIVGLGSYHYKSERSRQEGNWPLTGFAPRRQNLAVLKELIRRSVADMKKQYGVK